MYGMHPFLEQAQRGIGKVSLLSSSKQCLHGIYFGTPGHLPAQQLLVSKLHCAVKAVGVLSKLQLRHNPSCRLL